MKSVRSTGLLGRLMAILVLVVAFDFLLNAIVFERASDFSIREEDEARIANQLVIAKRLLEEAVPEDRPHIAKGLSTQRFRVSWSANGRRQPASLDLQRLQQQILDGEPELANSGLRLHLKPIGGGDDVAGSLILRDGSVVNFNTHVNEAFGITVQRLAVLLVPTLVLVIVGGLLVRAALQPLRNLAAATRGVGGDAPNPVPMAGTSEVRDLIGAFNEMQERIHELMRSRQTTISAIAHDLGTPLSRLQLRLEDENPDDEDRAAMARDISEMRMLLQSLQAFNQGRDTTEAVSNVDLASMLATLVDDARDRGYPARYFGPTHLEISGRPLALRRVATNLVENALHYGGGLRVRLWRDEGRVAFAVEDDGPGIAEDRLSDVLQPFVRLDEARSRDTPGMGLGLAIVDEIVRAEGGTLTLCNREQGGLLVTVKLPGRSIISG